MKNLSPRVRSRLRQAQKAADNNKLTAAEQLYREILETDPDIPEAWAGLAHVLRDEQEKEAAYQQALVLDPDHAGAQRGLGILRGEIVEEEIVEKEPEPETMHEPAPEPKMPAPEPKMPASSPATSSSPTINTETTYCVNHPDKETTLRCNRCGKAVCSKCVQRTPVGYRCKDCIWQQEETFFTADWLHYAVTAFISFPLSLIAVFIMSSLGFWSIFIAPLAGTLIGRLVFIAIGRRRGRYIPHISAGMILLSAGAVALFGLLFTLFASSFAGTSGDIQQAYSLFAYGLIDFVWIAISAFLSASSAFYQLR